MFISKEIMKTLPIGQIIKNDLEVLKKGNNDLFRLPMTNIGEYGIILFNKDFPEFGYRKEYSKVTNATYNSYSHTSMYGECLDINGVATVRAYKSKVEDTYYWRAQFEIVQAPVKKGILQMDQFKEGQFILIEDVESLTKKVKTKHNDNFKLES